MTVTGARWATRELARWGTLSPFAVWICLDSADVVRNAPNAIRLNAK